MGWSLKRFKLWCFSAILSMLSWLNCRYIKLTVFLAVRKFHIQIPIIINHVTVEKQALKGCNHDAFFHSLHINIKSYFKFKRYSSKVFGVWVLWHILRIVHEYFFFCSTTFKSDGKCTICQQTFDCVVGLMYNRRNSFVPGRTVLHLRAAKCNLRPERTGCTFFYM